jgi:hypothetical protein
VCGHRPPAALSCSGDEEREREQEYEPEDVEEGNRRRERLLRRVHGPWNEIVTGIRSNLSSALENENVADHGSCGHGSGNASISGTQTEHTRGATYLETSQRSNTRKAKTQLPEEVYEAESRHEWSTGSAWGTRVIDAENPGTGSDIANVRKAAVIASNEDTRRWDPL